MSFFGDVSRWLNRQIESQAERISYVRIPDTHIYRQGQNVQSPAVSLKPNEHYFRLWVKEMRLQATTRWFTKFHPAVHSLTSITFANQTLDLARVAGPSEFEGVEQGNLDSSVALNFPLTSTLPFVGGDVNINLGLVSVPTKDNIGEMLEMVSDVTGILNVPQISTVVAFAGTAANSIRQFIGVADPSLQLYFKDTFTSGAGGSPLKSGYFVSLNLPEDQIDRSRLWVRDERLVYGQSAEAGIALNDADYMLIHLEALTERDDWRQFPLIDDPLSEALVAAINGESDAAKKALRRAKVAAYMLDDLTDTDKKRVMAAMDKIVEDQINLFSGEPLADIEVTKDAVTKKARVENALAAAMARSLGDYDYSDLKPLDQNTLLGQLMKIQ